MPRLGFARASSQCAVGCYVCQKAPGCLAPHLCWNPSQVNAQKKDAKNVCLFVWPVDERKISLLKYQTTPTPGTVLGSQWHLKIKERKKMTSVQRFTSRATGLLLALLGVTG